LSLGSPSTFFYWDNISGKKFSAPPSRWPWVVVPSVSRNWTLLLKSPNCFSINKSFSFSVKFSSSRCARCESCSSTLLSKFCSSPELGFTISNLPAPELSPESNFSGRSRIRPFMEPYPLKPNSSSSALSSNFAGDSDPAGETSGAMPPEFFARIMNDVVLSGANGGVSRFPPPPRPNVRFGWWIRRPFETERLAVGGFDSFGLPILKAWPGPDPVR